MSITEVLDVNKLFDLSFVDVSCHRNANWCYLLKIKKELRVWRRMEKVFLFKTCICPSSDSILCLCRINFATSTSGQFHQLFTSSFYTRRSQKHKNSQVKQLFALSGSALVKAACNHVGEIDPSLCKYTILV